MKCDVNDPTMPNPRWRVFSRGVLVCVTRQESEALDAFLAAGREAVMLSPGDYVVEAPVEGGAS